MVNKMFDFSPKRPINNSFSGFSIKNGSKNSFNFVKDTLALSVGLIGLGIGLSAFSNVMK